jgi:MFS-type transporter involved in bile tolerance (Atg22 family)
MESLVIRYYFLTISAVHWAIAGFVFFFPEAPNLLLKSPMSSPIAYAYAVLCLFCGCIYFIFRTTKTLELGAFFALLSLSLNAYSLLGAFSSGILIDTQNLVAKSSMAVGVVLLAGILISYRNILKSNYRN